MTIDQDKSGNAFITVGNVRVTWAHKGSEGWADSDGYLRIQAYKADPEESQALYPGAELPIRSGRDVCALIAAIATLAAGELAK